MDVIIFSMIKFPQTFLWGAATSSYQVEGNNVHADWWHWEKRAGKERSGPACRHYNRYEQDFDRVKKLHHNAHRLSIEWSRIEPQKGKFSRKELDHYRDVILALRTRGIEPIVTLHHFTNPQWFARDGGWVRTKSIDYFLRYCDVVVRALAQDVHYWVTINEPTIYISHSYLFGAWPPQEKNMFKAAAVEKHLVQAHCEAYRLVHKIYKGSRLPKPAVSIAQNVMAFVPRGQAVQNKVAAYVRGIVYNLGFIERIMRKNVLRRKPLDFIGINYYSRQMVEFGRFGAEHGAAGPVGRKKSRIKQNSLGWDIYPQGIYDVLLALKKYRLPLMVTENGICTADDDQRWKYIRDHLTNVHRAMQKGAKVMGYMYWSLMDNFEWDKGFAPRFGLIDINYKTQRRTIRKSARKYAQVCKTGILTG